MNALIAIISIFAVVCFAPHHVVEAEQKAADLSTDEAQNDGEIRIYKRLIPADVLRDFPGMCFASTRCATVEVGKSWDLTPFCGRSTCARSDEDSSKLLELVEDCGPLPLANDKCKLDTAKTNKTAPFPYCCPTFTCEPGVKLEYPEVGKEDDKKLA
ncbi:uncharacterized protein Dwil_GK13665 [Drosophila willistoni]|uniref:Single domain-containing protein n=1 Tax=Drosophila willistoni TaxID=7260 RepID=A0A0Q9X6L2_DROWI|nr:uncharacterized protein LOC6650068 [Drosophila willistoni]KRF99815.1 uncharacterized protein Dwil_GK13665 [Drosophila willistoni]